MAKHLDVSKFKESTKRAWRTFYQGLVATTGIVVLFAIPPVETAANSVLQMVDPDLSLPTGLVAAIGVLFTATAAAAAKIQNLVEGKDKVKTPDELAAYIEELVDLLNATREAGEDVVETVKPTS